MIIDNLKNLAGYKGLTPYLDQAIDYINKGLDIDMENGVQEINGQQIYSVCAEYETKAVSQGKNEAHRNYIDIQMLLKGKELIYASNINDLEITEEYDSDKDVLFLGKSLETTVEMKTGMFCIFFPWDAHMPGISCGNTPENVRKVVFKVHV